MNTIVIGGGASGMFCAAKLAEFGLDVTLIEKNDKLGKKLFITGKGRCNLTNDCPQEEVRANVVRGGKFLYSALNAFSPSDVVSYFEACGVPLKTERGGRVFPASDKSSDVIRALERAMREYGANILLNRDVKNVRIEDGHAVGVDFHGGGFMSADAVVIATGGVSYSVTGSSGDGYHWARTSGHTVVAPRAALAPVLLRGVDGLAGLSLKNVRATLRCDGKEQASEFGEMLFTHEGASGPIILTLSSLVDTSKLKGKTTLEIDLKPALNYQTLDARLQRECRDNVNKELKNIMPNLVPRSLIAPLLRQAAIPDYTSANSLTRAQRSALASALKAFTFDFIGLDDIEKGIITRGGVSLDEVSPKSMESKLIKGLYFIGEVLDIDALTGGFNLQSAWSTAYAAAHAIAEL